MIKPCKLTITHLHPFLRELNIPFLLQSMFLEPVDNPVTIKLLELAKVNIIFTVLTDGLNSSDAFSFI
jgi:hypothetical protein